jgi:hypothetical protein
MSPQNSLRTDGKATDRIIYFMLDLFFLRITGKNVIIIQILFTIFLYKEP